MDITTHRARITGPVSYRSGTGRKQFNASQVNGNIDYNFSEKDRLAAKYYFQSDPTSIPFGVSQVVGFPVQDLVQLQNVLYQLLSRDSSSHDPLPETARAAALEAKRYIRSVLDHRRRHPREPLDQPERPDPSHPLAAREKLWLDLPSGHRCGRRASRWQ